MFCLLLEIYTKIILKLIGILKVEISFERHRCESIALYTLHLVLYHNIIYYEINI